MNSNDRPSTFAQTVYCVIESNSRRLVSVHSTKAGALRFCAKMEQETGNKYLSEEHFVLL